MRFFASSSRLRLCRLGLCVARRGGDGGAAEVRVVGHHLVLGLVRLPLVDEGLDVVVRPEGLDGLEGKVRCAESHDIS